ncbi:MAG: hypothetical protein WCO07_00940 [bacterium]
MLQEDREKLNRIEEMKTKLFSKNYEVKIEHRDGFVYKNDKKVPESWAKEEQMKSNIQEKFFKKTSVFKKFFIFSIVFFVLALGYASYMFFAGGNTVSNDNIDIAVLGNTFTAGGEELPLQIEITNRNSSLLELADLIVEYPKGSSGDLSKDTERLRDSLGTIPSGAIKKDNMKVVLFGEQGSVRQVRVALEYRVEGSNAIFVKEKFFDVTISSAPIDLTVDAPTEISPNQDITLKVKATLNATKTASKILVKFDYPVGFQFISSNPVPSIGNNIWSLGDLSPGAERDISVTGKMLDVSDGEEKTFHIYSGAQADSDSTNIGVVFNSLGHTVLIKKPFIEAKLFINGVYQREYASDSKTMIQGEIRWMNNLETKINNLQIEAKLYGNALDRKTIVAREGFYNSLNDTIIWDKNSQYNFAEVNPGDSGSVSFSVSPLSLFSDLNGMLPDPTLNIDVSISGKQALEGNAITELKNSESKIVRIISDVGLASKALYYFGPFQNTGPIPPKKENETTYTVSWSLSNSSNNISKTQIRSTFPQWVRFVGNVSPASEDLTYNPSTKEIIWNVGNIPKGTGITEAGREVFFQIAFTPSSSQVGTAPVILNDTVLTGHDDFANVDVRVNKAALNTRLPNDTAFPTNGDRVVD